MELGLQWNSVAVEHCRLGLQWTTLRRESDHILVVDDDDGIREMLQSTLTFAGFRVSAASDAQRARCG